MALKHAGLLRRLEDIFFNLCCQVLAVHAQGQVIACKTQDSSASSGLAQPTGETTEASHGSSERRHISPSLTPANVFLW